MPSYHVQFESPRGETAEAALAAPSLPALAERLRSQGQALRRVLPPRPHRALRGYWRRITDAELTTVLRQLALSLQNGVPVGTALDLLARESPNLTLKLVLLDLSRSVRDGDSLSCAVARYPRLFSGIYVRLLESGEQGNRLPEVLMQLSGYAERAGQAALRIRTALVYPQVVGLFSLLLMCLSFVYVVPKFIQLFTDLGVKELPLITRLLLGFSGTVVPVLFLLLPSGAAATWFLYYNREQGLPPALVEFRSKIPLLGALYYNLGLLRLTRLLSVLLSGGIGLLEALRLAGQGAETPLLQAAMWDAIPHVAAGETLSGALSHAAILPPTFCGQIAAAETSGDLPAALARLSDFYSERVDYMTARISALLEPLFILVLAGLAGWIALGVFSPLIAIIQNLSGGG